MSDERDVSAYEEGYADGFDRGAEAVVQQIDGILCEAITNSEAMRLIHHWVEDFWKERES